MGLSIANNLLSDQIQFNLNNNQQALQSVTAHLSSGLRINGPADDAAGYAIATNLQTQVNDYDQASLNVQNGNSAVSIATGALSNINGVLQQISTLAISASSSLLSTTDRTNIQTTITSLVNEVNSIASNANFDGTSLLNGSSAGYQAAQNASVTVTSNSALASQSANLVSSVSVSTTNAGVIDGTLEFNVVNTGTTIATNVYYITSAGTAGQLISTVGNFNTTANYTLAGVTVSLSGVATSDVGSTSYVKVTQFVSSTNYTTQPALTIQTGSNAGQTISFNISAATAGALRIGNLNVLSSNTGFNSLAAEDVVGQVSNAISTVNSLQASLGAAQNRLTIEQDNDNLSAVNLQAAESNIRDLNVASASTQYAKDQLLVNVGNALISQANSSASSVLSLFR